MSCSLAEAKKETGNELYKVKNYRGALPLYTEAIALCPDVPSYYGNRAACYMMLSQFKNALEDARKAVLLDSNFVKGYVRIAKCCVSLGNYILSFYFTTYILFLNEYLMSMSKFV